MMWEQLQQKYAKCKGELQALEKYKKQQDQIQQQISNNEREVQRFQQQLNKEQATYEKLQTPSIINYLRSWTGKQDELREQNLNKIATTELKHIEAQLMQENLQDDLTDLLHKINAINESDMTEQLKDIRAKMEVWLMQHAPDESAKLTAIMEEQLLSQRLLIEIKEAIDAGNQAHKFLAAASKKINEADGYSTWDLLGGGFIATALKHSSLDESNSAVHEAQIALQRFKNELLDIQEIRHEDMHVKVDGLVHFADYFFDDIFSEWSVHSKIATAKQQINTIIGDVSNTIRDLHLKRNVVEDKLSALAQEKDVIFSVSDAARF